MKKYVLSMLAGTILAFSACTNDNSLFENVKNETETGDGVVFEVCKFASAHDTQSRTMVTTHDKGAAISWTEGDTIGIVPDEGAQIYFVIDNINPENSNKAVFTSEAWGLKTENSYAAYYPFIPDYSITRNRVPVDYTVQSYKPGANGSIIPSHDYMVARSVKQDQGNLKFSFTHLGALVEVQFAIPETASVKEFRLRANGAIFPLKGTFDLTADTVKITPTSNGLSHEILVNVEGLEAKANETVSVFFMMPPLNVKNFNTSNLSAAVVYGDNNDVLSLGITNNEYTQLKAGKYYKLNTQKKDFQPTLDQWKNILYYSLSGGKNKVRFVPCSTETSDISYEVRGNAMVYVVTKDDWTEIHTLNDMYLPENVLEMFNSNPNLKEVDLSNLKTDRLKDMSGMFKDCTSLEKVTFGTNFNTENVTKMDSLFKGCSSLTTIDINHFNLNNVEGMSYMFQGCSSLVSVDLNKLNGINMEKEHNLSYMFADCTSLQSLDLTGLGIAWAFFNVNSMFKNCSVLKTLDLRNFDFGLVAHNLNNSNGRWIVTTVEMFLGLGSGLTNGKAEIYIPECFFDYLPDYLKAYYRDAGLDTNKAIYVSKKENWELE